MGGTGSCVLRFSRMENTEPVVAGSIDEAGLVYSADSEAGITRRRRGKGWSYRDPQGRTIADLSLIHI